MGNIRFCFITPPCFRLSASSVCLRCNTESEWSQIHENIIKKANSRYNLSGSNTGKNDFALNSLCLLTSTQSQQVPLVMPQASSVGTDPFMFCFIVWKNGELGAERGLCLYLALVAILAAQLHHQSFTMQSSQFPVSLNSSSWEWSSSLGEQIFLLVVSSGSPLLRMPSDDSYK